MMRNSLLYRLHSHQLVEGVEADKNRFKEVYRTKYGSECLQFCVSLLHTAPTPLKHGSDFPTETMQRLGYTRY